PRWRKGKSRAPHTRWRIWRTMRRDCDALGIDKAHIVGASLGGGYWAACRREPSRENAIGNIHHVLERERALPQAKPEAMAIPAEPPAGGRCRGNHRGRSKGVQDNRQPGLSRKGNYAGARPKNSSDRTIRRAFPDRWLLRW